jgi:hypothetical protein
MRLLLTQCRGGAGHKIAGDIEAGLDVFIGHSLNYSPGTMKRHDP